METELFRKKNRKRRKTTNILFVIGIILIFAVPMVMVLISNNSVQSPIILSPKNDSISVNNSIELKLNDYIDLYLINSNEYYCIIRNRNKLKSIKLKKEDINNLIKKYPEEIYRVKACRSAKYNDFIFVIDVLLKNKVKRYTIVDLNKNDSIILGKLGKL